MASEQEWVNAVKGDDEFGLLRYQLTFTDGGDYGPIKYTVRIRGVNFTGTVTPQEIGAIGGTWWHMIEDHLRREHHLPACDRRSPEQKRIEGLEAERDALAAQLATLTAAGIVVGEDGVVTWHGMTGAEIDRLMAVVEEVRPTVRDINAFIAGWEATRDDTHAIIAVSRRLLRPFLGSAAALSIALAATSGRGAEGGAME